MGDKNKLGKITFGILTVSDRCSNHEALDESGRNLAKMIEDRLIERGEVMVTALVPDDKVRIAEKIQDWCDVHKVHVILTTGGTGIAKRDVTPEATAPLLDKEIPGIPSLIFKRSSEMTPLAALSRSISGVRGETLIVNLPGSKKASQECLESIVKVIPHAVDLIRGNSRNVERVHSQLEKRKSKVSVGNVAERPRSSQYSMLSVSAAQETILERIFILRAHKTVNFESALGFVLADDVVASCFLPSVDVSLMDGYAFNHSTCSEVMEVIGRSAAGSLEIPDIPKEGSFCVRINTGGAIPRGADTVVPVENTKVCSVSPDNTEEKKIRVDVSFSRGSNIRAKGSDFKKGELILKRGVLLDPPALGLMAAAGVTSVTVFAKPIVGVLSSGDELVDSKDASPTGKIRDSNRVTLLNILKEENFPSLDLGIVADNPDDLCGTLERGFRAADIVVTSGGVSMGDRDFLKEVLVTDFGAELCFGRVNMKPGKPTAFAHVTFEGKPKLWFGLPGNPASATVTAQLFLLPALRKISGLEKVLPPVFPVTIEDKISVDGRPHYVRAALSWDVQKRCFVAKTTGDQRSSRISSCVNANSWLVVPETNTKYVDAVLFGKLFYI